MSSREAESCTPSGWTRLTVPAMLLVAATGCGGPAYEYDAVVTGTVTIDGELANSGTVTFHPVDDEGKVAVGRIYPDGSFSMRTGQGDLRRSDGGTVVPGQYIITVLVTGPPPPDARLAEGGPPLAGPPLMHSKYTSKETSDLHRTVARGRNVFDLRLEGAEHKPVAEDRAPTEMADETMGTQEVEEEDTPVDTTPATPAGEEADDATPADVPPEPSPSDRTEEGEE